MALLIFAALLIFFMDRLADGTEKEPSTRIGTGRGTQFNIERSK